MITLRSTFKDLVRKAARRAGYDIVRYPSPYPPDFSANRVALCDRVSPYTMTTPERVDGLAAAVEYVVKQDIPGALVECGVWKGGSAMAMALTLLEAGVRDRDIYLYDTFSGMSAPGEVDVAFDGRQASEMFEQTKQSEDASDWCRSPLDEVRRNVESTGYPPERLHFVEGKVEDTIPGTMPEDIAILRLDTDWYESTKHELTHLYPRLVEQGLLLIDDYGHWRGARKAVDEYIDQHGLRLLLNRLDYTGRIAIKS